MEINGTLEHYIGQLNSKVDTLETIDTQAVNNAIEIAKRVHADQFRRSGTPFLIHPIRVACKALEYKPDTVTVVASILHDTIEDCKEDERENLRQEIKESFDGNVLDMVEALTKIKGDNKKTLDKIISQTSKDFRVVLVKLFDRLDNLSELAPLKKEKQRRIMRETDIIYSSLANELGLKTIERELRDLIFKNRYPLRYKRVSKKLVDFYNLRHTAIEKLQHRVDSTLMGKVEFETKLEYYNTERFLSDKNEIEHILDVVRIVTATIEDCYRILGLLHTQFRAIPRNFRDYISNPKINGYRGLLTKIAVNNETIRIEIVTRGFEKKNERGILSYLEEGIFNSQDYTKFLEHYREVAQDQDLRIEEIYYYNRSETIQLFTPKGLCIELAQGATVHDFAFHVHSEIGLKCIGAIIDGIRFPKERTLNFGETIDVLTSDSVKPRKDWLNHLIMPRSRQYLIKYLKKQNLC